MKDSGTGYTFVIDDIIGDVINPHEISIGGVTLSIDLGAGWNWISFNVDPTDASISSVLESVSETATFINSQSSGTATNYGEYGWYGTLSELNNSFMYEDKADASEILNNLRKSNLNNVILGHLNINSIANKVDSLSFWYLIVLYFEFILEPFSWIFFF